MSAMRVSNLLCFAVCVLLSLSLSEQNGSPTVSLTDVPVTVLQELLRFTDDGVIDGRLDAKCKQIYRLRGREVSYYEFTFNGQYIIVANPTPTHMDKIFVSQGPLPSPTQSVDEMLAKENSTCYRYVLVGPSGPLACENSDDTLTAGSDEWKYVLAESGQLPHLQNYDGTVDWNRAFRLSEKQLRQAWEDSENEARRSSDVLRFVQTASNPRRDEYIEDVLAPGTTVKIVKTPYFTRLNIDVIGNDRRRGSLSHLRNQEKRRRLCEFLSGVVCKHDSTAVSANVEQESSSGLVYLAVTLTANASRLQEDFGHETVSVIFSSQYSRGGLLLTLRYGLDVFDRRQKRWSSWTFSSIPYETQFPDYNQFTYGSCQVGCGPVAWAMILGYLDRLAHNSYASYSTSLYPHGMAPSDFSSANSNLKSWIGNLHNRLGTFCLFGQGATLVSNMGRISSYYKGIQSGGVFKEKKSWWYSSALVASYQDSFRDAAISYIRQGSPAVIGWKVSGLFSQHYPVATRVRQRSRQVRTCSRWKCSTKTEYEREFYLHMGWGGSGNGWKKAQAYYAATITK